MMKFPQLMTYGVGDKQVTFTGREPFAMDDAEFKKALLAVGVFESLDGGLMRYSGKVSVPGKDGKEHLVSPDGYVNLKKSEFENEPKDSFR